MPPSKAEVEHLVAALFVVVGGIARARKKIPDGGQITLTVDPTDRRSFRVELTDRGKEEVERLTSTGLERFASFVADWTSEEVREFTRLLVKFEASKAAAVARQPPPSAPQWRPR